jgi:hypothetical protein
MTAGGGATTGPCCGGPVRAREKTNHDATSIGLLFGLAVLLASQIIPLLAAVAGRFTVQGSRFRVHVRVHGFPNHEPMNRNDEPLNREPDTGVSSFLIYGSP